MEEKHIPEHRLISPAADLNGLSVCNADPEAIGQWASELPMANIAAAASHLRTLVFELSRLRTDYLTRLELLESIRPTVYYAAARIDRQAQAGGIRWQASLDQAQELQRSLAEGYKAVVLGALPIVADDKSARESALQSIHRGLSDLAHVWLRALRHYLPAEPGLWLDLNQLCELALSLDCGGHRVRDPENHNAATTTILQAWLRPALLSLARPNQLRPAELNQLFNALEQWSAQVSLQADPPQALFSVDLSADHPPTAARRRGGGRTVFGVQTDVLAYELEAFLREIPSSVPVPDFITAKLLRHVATAWSSAQSREHRRMRLSGGVEVGIGLRTASACLAHEMEARRERERARENAPEVTTPAPVSSASTHTTSGRDTSPLGYRLTWPDGLPPTAQVGELLALREEGAQGWCIGVLRWIGTERGGAAETGVELLSPTAVPVSARVVRTRGGISGYSKALLLPAIPALQREASIITPRMPFQPMQKVQMQRGRSQTNLHLGPCIAQTENYNQFAFRLLGSYLENGRSPRTMASLNSRTGVPRPTNDS